MNIREWYDWLVKNECICDGTGKMWIAEEATEALLAADAVVKAIVEYDSGRSGFSIVRNAVNEYIETIDKLGFDFPVKEMSDELIGKMLVEKLNIKSKILTTTTNGKTSQCRYLCFLTLDEPDIICKYDEFDPCNNYDQINKIVSWVETTLGAMYIDCLYKVVTGDNESEEFKPNLDIDEDAKKHILGMVLSTPRQRAEALLMAIVDNL